MPHSLPPEVTQRISQRLEEASPHLFRMLDDAREFGANYLIVRLKHPRTGELMQLVLAPPNVELVPETQEATA